jgi:cell division protein FtsQ
MILRGSLGQRISWGDSSDAVLKSKVLQALMANNGGVTGVTFDVSSPNAPVVRFDNF